MRTAQARLEAELIRQTVAGCQTEIGCRALALALAGSLARQEGSWMRERDGSIRLLGDAEALLIVSARGALPRAAQAHRIERQVEQRLHAEGIEASISLTPVRVRYLRELPAHIFGYELRNAGRVLWGDRRILDLVPGMERAQLPRADAWRLLANRMIELLPSAWLQRRQAPTSHGEIYPWVKLYLDMATSLLVFQQAYAPSYRERAARMRLMAAQCPLGEAWVGDLEECTEWKLRPNEGKPSCFASPQGCIEAIGAARMLWRWELRELTSSGRDASDQELWQRWLRQQSWGSRLRGWMSAARRNLPAAGRHWPRWAWMARRASPRHWIYSAGSDLLFRLSELGDPDPACDAEVLDRLPMPRTDDRKEKVSRAEEAVALVGTNYRSLVVSTRA